MEVTVLTAFEEVSTTCRSLLHTSGLDTALLVQGGLKSMLLHPIKTYILMIKRGLKAHAEFNSLSLFPLFPADHMLGYLSKYTVEQLVALKSLSAIGVVRKKLLLTDNPTLKFTGALGSLYALIQIGDKLVPNREDASSFAIMRNLLDSPMLQTAVGYLLGGVLLMLVMFGIQYVFQIGPAIARTQLLDDLLALALHDRAFAAARGSHVAVGR